MFVSARKLAVICLFVSHLAVNCHADDWNLGRPDKLKHAAAGALIGAVVVWALPHDAPWWTKLVLGIAAAETAGRLKEFIDPVYSPADVHATRLGGLAGASIGIALDL